MSDCFKAVVGFEVLYTLQAYISTNIYLQTKRASASSWLQMMYVALLAFEVHHVNILLSFYWSFIADYIVYDTIYCSEYSVCIYMRHWIKFCTRHDPDWKKEKKGSILISEVPVDILIATTTTTTILGKLWWCNSVEFTQSHQSYHKKMMLFFFCASRLLIRSGRRWTQKNEEKRLKLIWIKHKWRCMLITIEGIHSRLQSTKTQVY